MMINDNIYLLKNTTTLTRNKKHTISDISQKNTPINKDYEIDIKIYNML